jgi:hypothetical protein
MWSALVVLIQSGIILFFAPMGEESDLNDHLEIVAAKDYEYLQGKLSGKLSSSLSGEVVLAVTTSSSSSLGGGAQPMPTTNSNMDGIRVNNRSREGGGSIDLLPENSTSELSTSTTSSTSNNSNQEAGDTANLLNPRTNANGIQGVFQADVEMQATSQFQSFTSGSMDDNASAGESTTYSTTSPQKSSTKLATSSSSSSSSSSANNRRKAKPSREERKKMAINQRVANLPENQPRAKSPFKKLSEKFDRQGNGATLKTDNAIGTPIP